MAKCPICGSEHIQLTKNNNPNWENALVGGIFFGGVGALIGSNTGNNENSNNCLDCGTIWNPVIFYKRLVQIKKITNRTLDLAIEKDREYLYAYMNEIFPIVNELNKLDDLEKYQIDLSEKQVKRLNDLKPFLIGCFVLILFSFPIVGPIAWMSPFFLFFLIKCNPMEDHKKGIKRIKSFIAEKKKPYEVELNNKIRVFNAKY